MKKVMKLKGLSANNGSAQGKVVFVREMDDIKKVHDGDVVITDKITSEFTSAFLKASAIVSSRGGVTCHVAIICREFNKPCVVACADAFKLFKENAVIKIDTKKLEYQEI